MLLKTTLKQPRRENTWIWKRGLEYPVSDRRGESQTYPIHEEGRKDLIL
jgi:hypothetical protein